MNLAIDTIEVAVLIRIHVYPHRQASRAGGNDRVNELVIQEIAGRTKSGLERLRVMERRLFLVLARIGRHLGNDMNWFHFNVTVICGSVPNYTMLAKFRTFFGGQSARARPSSGAPFSDYKQTTDAAGRSS